MKMAGLLDNTLRGYIRISPSGLEVLGRKPERIDMKFLRKFPSYLEFGKKSQTAGQAGEAENRPAQAPQRTHRLGLQDAP